MPFSPSDSDPLLDSLSLLESSSSSESFWRGKVEGKTVLVRNQAHPTKDGSYWHRVGRTWHGSISWRLYSPNTSSLNLVT